VVRPDFGCDIDERERFLWMLFKGGRIAEHGERDRSGRHGLQTPSGYKGEEKGL
jgi:hypothetical protein